VIRIRSRHSRRRLQVQRSAIAFARGAARVWVPRTRALPLTSSFVAPTLWATVSL